MNSDDEDDIPQPEKLPIYLKGKEIFDLVNKIVRELIEEYRLLFIDRVAGIDKWDYVIDRWGLFNPLGIGPFNKDPDDDIPFHGFEEDPEE